MENTQNRSGGKMGKDKGPPADSGSFCEAVGVVSEAHGGGALNEQLNEATEPMGARYKGKRERGSGAIVDMSSSPKKPQNDPLSTIPRCASLSASFYS